MNDDDRVKRIGEILDALREQTLPPEELARLERELDQYAYVCDPGAVCVEISTPTNFPLLKPQIDMNSVYKRRTELDRKLFGPQTHDRP